MKYPCEDFVSLILNRVTRVDVDAFGEILISGDQSARLPRMTIRLFPSSVIPFVLGMMTVVFHVVVVHVGRRTTAPSAALLIVFCTSVLEQLGGVTVAALASQTRTSNKKMAAAMV